MARTRYDPSGSQDFASQPVLCTTSSSIYLHCSMACLLAPSKSLQPLTAFVPPRAPKFVSYDRLRQHASQNYRSMLNANREMPPSRSFIPTPPQYSCLSLRYSSSCIKTASPSSPLIHNGQHTRQGNSRSIGLECIRHSPKDQAPEEPINEDILPPFLFRLLTWLDTP